MLKPQMKYMRAVYSYISGSSCYVNPYWNGYKPLPLYSYLLMATSCADLIIICICYVV